METPSEFLLGVHTQVGNLMDKSWRHEVSSWVVIPVQHPLEGWWLMGGKWWHVCEAVHPCRVNDLFEKSWTSVVMYYLETFTWLLDNWNGYFKNLKISVSAMGCFLVGKSRKDPWWCIDVVIKIRWARVRLSSLLYVVVVQDSQVKAFCITTPLAFTLIPEHK